MPRSSTAQRAYNSSVVSAKEEPKEASQSHDLSHAAKRCATEITRPALHILRSVLTASAVKEWN